MNRQRLRNRRASLTETISIARADGAPVSYEATVGFDNYAKPREIFLSGAKAGSDMAAALEDTAVSLSVALQYGVPAAAMARSISRIDGQPTSIVGAALDLICRYEGEAQSEAQHYD